MTTFVRVRDELGNEFSIPEDSQYVDEHTVLEDEPAADAYGHALPPHVAPTPVVDDDTGDVLRGQALTDALTAVGLPTHGTVAEKQARLAEHHVHTDTEENI